MQIKTQIAKIQKRLVGKRIAEFKNKRQLQTEMAIMKKSKRSDDIEKSEIGKRLLNRKTKNL